MIPVSINSVKLIFFSPTRTTQKIIHGISLGFAGANTETIDLTLPDGEGSGQQVVKGDLALIGAPVYGGRLPAVAASRLKRIEGNGVPAVVVVVYGNRAYEDALLELRDVVLDTGFKPIAAGAFIGEHSYSAHATPIAVGRPDTRDLEVAQSFGHMINEKLMREREQGSLDVISVPGNRPYKELRMLSDIAPVTDEVLCKRCMECVAVCPTGAIRADDPTITERDLCLRCCACVKVCSEGARAI